MAENQEEQSMCRECGRTLTQSQEEFLGTCQRCIDAGHAEIEKLHAQSNEWGRKYAAERARELAGRGMIEIDGLAKPAYGKHIATMTNASPDRRLTIETDRTTSHYGMGVLVDMDGPIHGVDELDGANFRVWRDMFGAQIVCKTGWRERVCHALGVPEDEPGITEADEVPYTPDPYDIR